MTLNEFQIVLTKYWGYSSFRPLQEDIIRSVFEGRDTLALMPTGGGKSITFQVPALARDGICIVVTPLIALMKDQVENLKKKKIKASAIYSGMSRHEIDVILENCVHDPNQKFLYCSPERLGTELFRTRVQQMNVNLIAVDESHCISQWGYDFRPSYLRISEIRQLLPSVPILAVTATATPEVVKDIQDKLRFKEYNVFRKSFERNNLVYLVREVADKESHLLKIVKHLSGSGLVYVRNRKKTMETAILLKENGVSADFYHAGLSPVDRSNRQEEWKQGRTRVMVCTNAFGMGIDKPDVRFVVHLDIPDNLEAYFQEAGRAGRDEQKAFAVLLWNQIDVRKLEQRIDTSFPPTDDVRRVYDALGNYFQLPVGAGKGIGFDFNLMQFVKSYNFNILHVYNSLNLLQNAGYIETSDEVNHPTRIMFRVQRDDLYKYQVANEREDMFIKTLLRLYTGLFSEYRSINEIDLAKRLGVSKSVINDLLIKISRDKIIHYIPQKDSPQIFYHEERLESKSVVFPREVYLDRKERYRIKMEAVIKYVQHNNRCRSQQLLLYFGESNAERCGQCDVCTERNELDMSRYEFDLILESVKKLSMDQGIEMEILMQSLSFPEEKALKVVNWLIHHDKLVLKNNLLLCWNKTEH